MLSSNCFAEFFALEFSCIALQISSLGFIMRLNSQTMSTLMRLLYAQPLSSYKIDTAIFISNLRHFPTTASHERLLEKW